MSSANDTIRIDQNDLNSPAVEAFLQTQQAMRRNVGELAPQPLVIRVIYSSWFYLALASGFGAFVAWMIMEPFFDDNAVAMRGQSILARFLLFPTVAGFIGLFLGAAEGLMCRNSKRAVICGVVGLGIGFGGGLVAIFIAGHHLCNHDDYRLPILEKSAEKRDCPAVLPC